jgi:hypothetical protein
MSVKLYTDNLVKQATLTASSENAQFPLSNLKDDRRSKVFQSTTTACNIVFDFGDIREIDSVCIVESGFDPIGFTSATIELNSVNSWVSPPVSQVLTIDPVNGWVNYDWASVQNYRFARISFVNTPNPIEVSKVFIGKRTELDQICFSYPINYKQNNNASVTRNRLGQKFIDEVNTQKEFSGSINTMTKDEVDQIFEVVDYASFTKPIWVNFNGSYVLNDENKISGYYYLNDDPTFTLQSGNYWSVGLSFTEGT